MAYAGLPPATIAFLQGLAAHNDRDWFDAHRAGYDRDWLAAGLDLVAALSEPCSHLGLLAVPKLNASLRRIHRDVRFSKDKRPYTPHLHLILSTGPDFNKVPGVHLLVSGQGIGFGAGVYGMPPAALTAYRERVCDGAGRAELDAVLAKTGSVGAALVAPDLARVPKGYAAAPWDGLIRRKSVIVRSIDDPTHPDWLCSPAAVAGWMRIVTALAPLAHWLVPFTAS